jgi:glutamate dehydrogenase
MLRSHAIRLVAAFNHQHIFIDPNPDPEKSFAERKRLFELPRSTWADYDASTISAGGGVFERSAKEIPLSQEARALLDLQAEAPSGEEVIRHILTMKVDLLYNGGIGTYIKASNEENAEVGDRSNDRVRVDAASVRARVIGEGGNLGLTQAARLEYWTKGGLINTDAIDNSAGVDMSDHEVNLKVLLDVLLHDGLIKSREDRNRILREMTDEVSDLVLADNEQQALALTLDGLRSASLYDDYVAFVDDLVVAGIVNREDDGIPTRDVLLLSNPARDRGLPRPLLAVVMGHVKNWAQATVLKTSFPDSETARPFLDAYFPKRLRDEFADSFVKHPLRREIIATAAINYVINKAGVRFIFQMLTASKKDLGAVVQAYLDLDRESSARELRARVLGGDMVSPKALDGLLKIESTLAQATRERLDGKTADVAKSLKSLAATSA